MIGFSVAKTPKRQAAEITRRLLPAARADAAILAAERADRDARLAGRLATLERARELLEGDLTWDEHGSSGQEAEFEHARTHRRHGEAPHVVIELRDSKRNDHMDEVRVSRLDHE
ncbi:hypothetical protein [Actinomadura sp. 6N118]|uniref:hypothetical protein n=1 Tax=Actinomadura sp. 6N118 TaxID=3375151 RepID=UPI00379371B6